jgi:hypothetical protein
MEKATKILAEWRWLIASIAAGAILGGIVAYGMPFIRGHFAPATDAEAMSAARVSCAVTKWPDASVSLTPSVVTARPGESFAVQVSVNTAAPSQGSQFGLKYDLGLLQVLGADEGTFYRDWAKDHYASTLFLRSTGVDPELGRLKTMGIAVVGGQMGFGATGPGLVATVHFQAIAGKTGHSTLTLDDLEVSSFDNCQTPRSVDPVTVTDAVVSVGEVTLPAAPQPRALHPPEKPLG